MSKPVCEALVSRPGAVEGWNDWGYLRDSATGPEFISLNHGLESHLSLAESYYHLAAANLCDIRGKHLSGQMVAESPEPLIPSPDVVVQVAHEPPPPMPSQTVMPEETASALTPGTALIYGAVVIGVAVLAFFSHRRTQATDTTPKPNYPDIFNQEDSTDG
jgi:hypothetical protein